MTPVDSLRHRIGRRRVIDVITALMSNAPGAASCSFWVLEGGGLVATDCTIIGEVTLGPGVVIEPHCVLGRDVRVGGYSRLGLDVVVGAGTTIGERTVIERGTRLGSSCTIGSECYVGRDNEIRDDQLLADRCVVVAGAMSRTNYVPRGNGIVVVGERAFTVTRPLRPSLATAGYTVNGQSRQD